MGKKFSGKMSRTAEKQLEGGPFGLAGYGVLRSKTGKTYFIQFASQIVQFGAIIFCRTFKNYFGQFVWIEKKRKATLIVAFHFIKRRLETLVSFLVCMYVKRGLIRTKTIV